MVDNIVECENVYVTSKYTKTMDLDEYVERYVDIPTVGTFCSLCKNYGKSWECPPHTIDVEEYWKKFKKIKIIAVKLKFNNNFSDRSYSHEQLKYIIANTLYFERSKMKKELIELEKELSGEYLYAGRCDYCKKCAKITGEKCRFPHLMRYSVESIGSNIQKLTHEVFDFDLKWIGRDMKIPEYLVNVCAVLY